MKRIYKTPDTNLLTQYAGLHPDHEWDKDFKACNNNKDYLTIREIMVSDQGGLCGYCEAVISGGQPKRVEHFHDKSDKSSCHNWALDWENVFAVCNGGSGYETDKTLYPTPSNLSCDAHKSHLKNNGFVPPEGVILNPLTLINTPTVFYLDKYKGKLKANTVVCEKLRLEVNTFNTVAELVDNTIKVLNLNCYRLTEQRCQLVISWSKALKVSQKMNNPKSMEILVHNWFSQRWPEFFTTRRLIAGKFAERYLAGINYKS